DELRAAAALAFVDPERGATAQLPYSLDLDTEAAAAQAGVFLVRLDSTTDVPDVRVASLAAVDALDEQYDGPYTVDPFNFLIVNAAISDASLAEMPQLMAIGLVLIVIILSALYRKVSDVVLALVGLIVTVIWMAGLSVLVGPGYLGITGNFTQISVIVPIFLIGLGVDYGLQLTFRYREERADGLSPNRSSARALSTVGAALALAAVTTTIGFMTNLASPLPPIRDYGLFASLGVLSGLVVFVLLVPSVRTLLDSRSYREDAVAPTGGRGLGVVGRVARGIGDFGMAAPVVTILVAALLTGASVVAAFDIETVFDADEFIPDGTDIERVVDDLVAQFGGDLTEQNFVLVEGDVRSPERQAGLAAVADGAAALEGTRQAGTASLVTTEIAEDGELALITVPTTVGQEGARALADELLAIAAPLEAAGLEVRVASDDLLLDETNQLLARSGRRGILLALLASTVFITSYFGVVDRRPWLGLLSMAVTTMVVAWTVGSMWLFGIDFNILTVTLASVAVGLSIDYGIHMTHRFIEEIADPHLSVKAAIDEALSHTGAALTGSAATTVAGFGVLMFSGLVPIRQFGTLMSVSIVFALIGSVLVQPAVLLLWGRRRRHREPTES
ncbi:MAG: RND family transporter, partial [Acidimicrobiales bacterium]